MLAQVSLTPAESKKLIAKAVARMEAVRRAAAHGTIVLHPSSSTYFLVEELLGHKPPTNTWVCGVVAPKGTCVEMGAASGRHAIVAERPEESPATGNPGAFRHSYVIRGGKFSTGIPLDDLLAEMGPGDVYVKGVNALDPEGKVGVLIGNLVEGGTIGRVMAASRRRGFTVIFPVGLEKLIPIPVAEAARAASRKDYRYSMGMPCSLLPCEGEVITELRAIEILSGARAVPIACGGLGGAEGAVTLVVQGETEQVEQAVRYIEECKGARLPDLRTSSCFDCPATFCTFPIGDKPWVVM